MGQKIVQHVDHVQTPIIGFFLLLECQMGGPEHSITSREEFSCHIHEYIKKQRCLCINQNIWLISLIHLLSVILSFSFPPCTVFSHSSPESSANIVRRNFSLETSSLMLGKAKQSSTDLNLITSKITPFICKR